MANKIDWRDKAAVKAYNAERQRAWRRNNSEKYLEAQIRQAQRRLERIRAAKAAQAKQEESEGCER